MLQGVSSNAGKSVLAAALCRILLSRGYRVLPFKAQNMALNSYVTSRGEEIGRAQAVQAAACRVEPDARVNPVLLKPSSNVGSQVIVMGKPIGSMEAKEYYGYKENLVATVREAYDSLSGEADVVVLEGAGSPAEMNLRPHDIVNMEMARYAEAAVLLAGDIDRGGVYASFVGTMEVFNHWERDLVKGFLVNKFRGDASLLEDAHRYLFERTGKRVLGVIPYLPDHGIPEEDSVTFKEALKRGSGTSAPGGPDAGLPGNRPGEVKLGRVRIRVVDLKHISNFTDFDCFGVEPDVDLGFVSTPEELMEGGSPDAVIIPGSKNVAADLEDLRLRGFESAIGRLVDEGGSEIVGICGGYQMLGREIADPRRVEAETEWVEGFGFLPLTTVFGSEKTLSRKSARHLESNLPVEGYEIHHGSTAHDAGNPLIVGEDGRTIGSGREDARVWGTYLHGIFDADRFRRWYLDRLRRAKGWDPVGTPTPYDIDAALDRLAQEVERHVDLEAILLSAGLR
jgi:adenosylcobyric acid synthase